MSIEDHRANAAGSVPCFVLTVSDTRTLETDTGGRAIADLLTGAGHTVVDRLVVEDDVEAIAAAVRYRAGHGDVHAILITGGTGVASRDVTPDAVEPLFDKHLEGFGELFRKLSFEEIGAAAMISRATAGLLSGCVIFVMPGSEKAVRLAMERLILPELGHIVHELTKDADSATER